jgi:SAM-dependent methyltransferase
VPLVSETFDLVFSVEAIEHALNLSAAVEELVRLARPGGWVLIIGKQQEHVGRFECPPWEFWPTVTRVTELLQRSCDHVSAEAVSYDGRPADGLMVAWKGQKRSNSTHP